jgi:hypothetical protein
MKLPKTVLFIPVLILISLGAVAGCGGDNVFSDDGGVGGAESCPCFSQDDVVNTAGQATVIECANSVFGLLLLYNDPASTAYTAHCKSDGTGCTCSSASGTLSVTQPEYNVCVNNLLDGLLMFNVPTIKVTGCVPE